MNWIRSGAGTIVQGHVSDGINYRSLDRKLWKR